jgi:cell division protein FtsB
MGIIEIIISNIITLFVSLGVTILFFKEKKTEIKLNNLGLAQENRSKEVDTLNRVIDTLQEENSRLREESSNKTTLVEKLYESNGQLRDRNNDLTTQNALLNYTKCIDETCPNRKPPRIKMLETNDNDFINQSNE